MIQPTLTIYGADWCLIAAAQNNSCSTRIFPLPGLMSIRTKNASDLVKQMNNGNRIIPTIILKTGPFWQNLQIEL
ncbi:MAG: hypothetical protein IPJ47_07180 [Anaerolineales bacterium]|nr:hypothetical protein [Anaerolineales bacterium]